MSEQINRRDFIVRTSIVAAVLLGVPSLSLAKKTEAPSEYLENYIILPGRMHDTYSYPDLLVGMNMLSAEKPVLEAAKSLGFTYGYDDELDTSLPMFGYYCNLHEALRLNLELGNITLNPRQLLDFKKLLEEGIQGKKRIYDGKGQVVNDQKLAHVYKEAFVEQEVRKDEYLDASFELVPGRIVRKNGMTTHHDHHLFIRSDHRLFGSEIRPTLSERVLTNSLLDDWSSGSYVRESSFNRQGLPTQRAKKKHSGGITYDRPTGYNMATIVRSEGLSLQFNRGYCKSYHEGIRPVRLKS